MTLAAAVALLLCAAALLPLAAAARRRRATADLGIVWEVGPAPVFGARTAAGSTLGSTYRGPGRETGTTGGGFGSSVCGPPVLQLDAIAAALQARVGTPPPPAVATTGVDAMTGSATTARFATGSFGVDVRGVWLVAAAGDAGCHAALCAHLARGDLALGRARWWGGGAGGAGGAALSTLPLSHALDLLPTLLEMRRDGGGGGSGGGGGTLELISRGLLVVRFGVVPLAPPPTASAALARAVRGPPVSRLLAAPSPLPRLVEVQLPAAPPRPGRVKKARVHAAAAPERYVVSQ